MKSCANCVLHYNKPPWTQAPYTGRKDTILRQCSSLSDTTSAFSYKTLFFKSSFWFTTNWEGSTEISIYITLPHHGHSLPITNITLPIWMALWFGGMFVLVFLTKDESALTHHNHSKSTVPLGFTLGVAPSVSFGKCTKGYIIYPS